uniref:Integrase catalytic domain-containing protein n=1 Tax=Trichuris muris TaxID=70415 RepID=A0A5S6QAF5_TRIMR
MHMGVEHTLAILRQKVWILRGRSSVKRALRACLPCKRYLAKPLQQKMGNLPVERVQPAFPFERVGLDFAGPLYVRSKARTACKAYVCLFTCMVTRVVHLELTSDISTEHFIQALRRFYARRGKPRVIQSDNFLTFKCAERELARMFNRLNREKVQKDMVSNGIEWKFITERAQWTGGYWQRLVRSVKARLRKVHRNALLDEEKLRTVLCEIEARINSKPLTFLVGRAYNEWPRLTKDSQKSEYWRKRCQYQKVLVAQFWNQWEKEYVVTMTSGKKWTTVVASPRDRDLVLIEQENVSRSR